MFSESDAQRAQVDIFIYSRADHGHLFGTNQSPQYVPWARVRQIYRASGQEDLHSVGWFGMLVQNKITRTGLKGLPPLV